MKDNLAYVLVVDDDQVARTMHRSFLERSGYCVKVASSGEEAVVLTKEQQFDLICMDVNMPGMDGIKAATTIRQQENPEKRIPIIGISSCDAEERNACLLAGMNTVLCKPVQVNELLHLAQEYIFIGDKT